MQTAATVEELKTIKGNQVILEDETRISMNQSEVRFEGKNNILYLQKGVHMDHCVLKFYGDNNVIFLSESSHKYRVDVTVHNESVFYVGDDVYFNGVLKVIISERTHIFIGRQCLFATDIMMRTADPHLIYSMDTFDRLNHSKSIFIGDHVWVGQNALILKGTRVHSGSIVGAHCVLSGKRVPSNVAYAGNPGKPVSSRIFWDETVVHRWKEEDTIAHEHFDRGDLFIYTNDPDHRISYNKLEKAMSKRPSPKKRLNYLKDLDPDKNRFAYVPAEKSSTGMRGLKKRLRGWLKEDA